MGHYQVAALPKFIADTVNDMYNNNGIERAYAMYDTNKNIFYIFGLDNGNCTWARIGKVDGEYVHDVGDRENKEKIDSKKLVQGFNNILSDAIERAEDEGIFHVTNITDVYILPKDDQLIRDLDSVLEEADYTNLKRRV